MVKCPHCDHRSISPLRKLLSARSRPIECQQCKGLSATPVVGHYQFVIGVIYLAIFPNLLSGATLNATDIAALTVIFLVKLLAPLRPSVIAEPGK